MERVTLTLTLNDVDRIEEALSMYIDYHRDGGDEESRMTAKRAEDTYDEIVKQIKWQ